MSLAKRRLLYICFILAFLIITPSLILYALGYSFQSGLKLQKSGILVIETEPSGASIALNDDKVQKFWSKILNNNNLIQTPAKIKNIKPGDYDVEVFKEGYWPWTKKLEILPGQTTFAEDIYLFKNNKPTVLQKDLGAKLFFSTDKRIVIGVSSTTSIFYDIEEAESKSIDLAEQIIDTEVKWSPNAKRVIFGNYIYNIDNWSNPISTKVMLGDDHANIEWVSNNSIVYSFRNKLYQMDIESQNNRELIGTENLMTIGSKNNELYIINESNSSAKLKSFNTDNGQEYNILDLPISNYAFINLNHHLLNILDTKHDILYLVNPNATIKPLVEIIHGANKMQWVTNNTLIYSTGFELWIMDLHNSEKKLLTRISDKINNISWHPSNNYIVFSTDRSINIFELDNRDKYSITKITNHKKINNMMLDRKGEIIYFSSGEKNDLYKIFIQ